MSNHRLTGRPRGLPFRRQTAFSAALALAGMLFAAANARAELPRIELTAGIHRIQAEVAHTGDQRQQGLMHRTYIGVNQGMLFVFPQAQR